MSRLLRFVSRRDLAQAWDSALVVCGGLAVVLAVLAVLHVTRPLGELLLAVTTGGLR